MKDLNSNQKFILITMVSMFLPFYIGFTLLAFNIFYLIYKGEFLSLIKETAISPYILTFVFYSLVMSFVFDNMLGIVATLGIFAIAIFGMTIYRYTSKELIDASIPMILGAALLNGLVSIGKYLVFYVTRNWDIPKLVDYWLRNRATSTFVNPNFFAMVSVFVLLISIYEFYTAKNKKRIVLSIATSLVMGISLVVAGSRGALLGFIPASILLIWMLRKNRPVFTICLCAAVVMIVLCCFKMGLFFRFSHMDTDFNTREVIWARALEAFRTNLLFGAGPNGFQAIYISVNNKVILHSHNIYLDFLVNYGLIGVMLLFVPAMNFVRAMRYQRHNKNFPLMIAMLLFLAIHGMVDVTIVWHQTAILLFMVILPTLSLNREEVKETEYPLLTTKNQFEFSKSDK